jgi:hypothetical protein
MMRRVTGIGGVFFQAKDPKVLCAWYKTHLGIDVQDWGGAAFSWADASGQPTTGTTIWSIGATGSTQFAPGTASHDQLPRGGSRVALQRCATKGCNVLEKTDDSAREVRRSSIRRQ